MTSTLSPEEVEALIKRLRERKAVLAQTGPLWVSSTAPDPDCIEAADALADLRRQLDEAERLLDLSAMELYVVQAECEHQRERIADMLDEVGATWAAGCVRTMPPPGERAP